MTQPDPAPADGNGKLLIGWTEYVSLPAWGIQELRAKVDTGARTSALHVTGLERLAGNRVRFEVILSRKQAHKRVTVETVACKWARVRSSTGIYRRRCFVRTLLRIGPVEKEIELSLVNREKMLFRMLIGRKALEHDFLVDASQRRLLGRGPDGSGSPGAPAGPVPEPPTTRGCP